MDILHIISKLLVGLSVLMSSAAALGQQAILYDEWGKSVNVAWANKDYAKVIEIISKKRSEVNAEASTDKTLELLEYDRNIAAATGRGKLGDPCPLLKQTNDNLLSSFDRDLTSDGLQNYRASIAQQTDEIIALVAEFDCIKKIAGSPDSELIGTYYLQGVMETGSGLKLMADARYQWFLSVGSLDMYSEGVWQRSGNSVQLIADPAPPKRKILTLGNVQPFGSGNLPCDPNDPTKMNYSVQLQPSSEGSVPNFALEVIFLYADGTGESLGGIGDDLRVDICLDKYNPPNAAEMIIYNDDKIFVEKFEITPQANKIQAFKFSEPNMQDSAWANQLLHIKGGNLIAPRLFSDNPYVKSDINLAN